MMIITQAIKMRREHSRRGNASRWVLGTIEFPTDVGSLLLMALLILVTLSATQADEAKVPLSWVFQPPVPNQIHFFYVGRSDPDEGLAAALAHARRDAMTHAIQEHFGAEFEASYEYHSLGGASSSRQRTNLDHQIRMRTPKSYMQGFEEVERSFRPVKDGESSAWQSSPPESGPFQVAVLYRYSRSAIEAEKMRQQHRIRVLEMRKKVHRKIAGVDEGDILSPNAEDDLAVSQSIGSETHPTDVTFRLVRPIQSATLTLDGTILGPIPGRFVGRIPTGRHTFQIEAEGYETALPVVDVQANRRISIPVALTPIPGLLTVEGIDDDSTIKVDGKFITNGALKDFPISPERSHRLRIEGPRIHPYSQVFSVKPSETFVVEPKLKLLPGYLTMFCNVRRAVVDLWNAIQDAPGARNRRLPLINQPLPAGSHLLNVSAPGYETQSILIEIVGGRHHTPLKVRLVREGNESQEKITQARPPESVTPDTKTYLPPLVMPELFKGDYPGFDFAFAAGSGTLSQVPMGHMDPLGIYSFELRFRKRWIGLKLSSEFIIKDGRGYLNPRMMGLTLGIGAPIFATFSNRGPHLFQLVATPELIYSGATATMDSDPSVNFEYASSRQFGVRARLGLEYLGEMRIFSRSSDRAYFGVGVDGYVEGRISSKGASPAQALYPNSPGLGFGVRLIYGY